MKKSVIVFISIIISTFLFSDETGLTVKIPDLGNAVDGRAETYTPHLQQESSGSTEPANREDWEIIDSLNINKLLRPGNHLGAYYDNYDNSLKAVDNQGELISESVAAISKSPNWVKADLENVLSQLSEVDQQTWANVINDAIDPYIDEIAFTIANLSIAHLESDYSYPQLIVENAQLIYDIDGDLSYVEVLDYGTSTTDPDFYSTTRYWKQDASGDLHQVEVPRDIYYWYIVHPKITDEIPAYIDPAHLESNTTHNNNIADPPIGQFWRNFLYNQNDEGYPKLRYLLENCDIAWNGTNLSVDNAVGATERWIAQSMQFTSNNERPHQPVRIYRKHIGRCGEHADLRAAALRIALIPGTSILTISTDHTWNEFWDEQWIHYDGGSVNNPLLYENGWGKTHASVFEIRSDGVLFPVSERYSGEYATLTLYAFDQTGTPIDGARFILGVRDGTQIRFDNAGYTDKEGKYVFTVGEGREYLAKMQSELGDDPISGAYALLVENAEAGEEYAFQFTSWDPMPTVPFSNITEPESTNDDFRLAVEYDVPTQVVSGDVMMDDVSNSVFYHSLSSDGSINFFMADLVWYSNYYAGFAFDTFNNVINLDQGSAEYDIPYGDWWYAFFDNSYRLNNPQKIVGSINLYNYDNAAGLGIISGTVTDAYNAEPIENAEVFAGVYTAVTNAAGEFTMEVAPRNYDVVTLAYGYESSTDWNIQVLVGEDVSVNPQLNESPLLPQNVSAIINDDNFAEISWDVPLIMSRTKHNNERELAGYNIYAGLCSESDEVSEWIALQTNYAENNYVHNTWNEMEPGIYKFAVEAVYSNDVSPKAFSNDLINNMTAVVEINISTNSGDSAEGAVITLTNQDNHPLHNYTASVDEAGFTEIAVWKGIYDFSISLDYFEHYNVEDLEISEDTQLDITLVELLSQISELSVIDYILSWEAAPSDRELLEYQIYIDDTLAGTISQGGVYTWDLSGYTGVHTAGVSAVYSTGTSAVTEIQFENGYSTYMGIYAYYPFSGNLNDESGNEFHGEMIGDISYEEDDVNGQALFFDAESEYINCPGVFAEAPLAFTVSWWLNPNSVTAWNQQIRSPGGWGSFVYHTTPEGSAYVGTSVGTRLSPANITENLTVNEWQFLTFTYSNGAGKMYKNGTLIGSKTDLADPTAWNGFWIGTDSANTIDGYADEVRLYNRVVGTAEVEHLYTDFAPYWGVLEGTVTSAIDQTPVSGAVISAGMFETVTDENGFYQMDVCGSTYAFVNCAWGDFDPEFTESIFVDDAETVTVDFEYNFTGITAEELEITNYKLRNFPNPFNPSTIISFKLSLEDTEDTKIEIYNVKGQKVDELEISSNSNLVKEVIWNAEAFSSGIYFYKLVSDGITLDSHKMLLVK